MSIRMRPLAWFAAALSGVNVLGTAFAAAMGEPWHAALHVGLAAGFGAWAQRLRRKQLAATAPGVETLEAELSDVQRELLETREDLDFAERMLAEKFEAERIARRDGEA